MLPPYHRQLVLPTVQAFLPPAQAQLVQRQQLQWQQLQQPAAEHATGQPAEPPAAEHVMPCRGLLRLLLLCFLALPFSSHF